ncbi:MAG: DivIVA domain-containing protein, partial [Gemmatimonadota bacterium]|nr:DivIVA domain-containing protein [Gemmatimonadota bacterium]
MKITPLDLKKTDFRIAFRGFDREEVQAMLTSAAETLEDAVRENLLLKAKCETLEEKARVFQDKESTLSETLIMAQKTSDQSRQNAQREAELITAKAEVEAEKILDKARSRLMELKLEVEELEHQKQAYMMRLRSLVASQWKLLQEEKEEDERLHELYASKGEEALASDNVDFLLPPEEGPGDGPGEDAPEEEPVSAAAEEEQAVEEEVIPPEENLKAGAEEEEGRDEKEEEEGMEAEEDESADEDTHPGDVSQEIRSMLKDTSEVAGTLLDNGKEKKGAGTGELDLAVDKDSGDLESPSLLWGDESAGDAGEKKEEDDNKSPKDKG